MPDHVHAFVSPWRDREQRLSHFMQSWKSCVTLRLKPDVPLWQREFFDRLLRSGESLSEKWAYVKMNPVRAGLCGNPDEYPFSGTPEEILSRLSRRETLGDSGFSPYKGGKLVGREAQQGFPPVDR